MEKSIGPIKSSKFLFLIGGAIGIALVSIKLIGEHSELLKSSNIQISTQGFKKMNLQFFAEKPNRCNLAVWSKSTTRRSNKRIPKILRDCYSRKFSADQNIWRLSSTNKSVIILHPAEAISDWVFPFFYGEYLHSRTNNIALEIEWIQLFVNRIYNGLFLKIIFPKPSPKKEGNKRDKIDFLFVSSNRMRCVTSDFQIPCRIYPKLIVEGIFPEKKPTPLHLSHISHLLPKKEIFLILRETPIPHVVEIPLILAYSEIFERSISYHIDERYKFWQVKSVDSFQGHFSQKELEDYLQKFKFSVESYCSLSKCNYNDIVKKLNNSYSFRKLNLKFN